MPHGLPLFSRFLSRPPASGGKADSTSTWCRRRSTMVSTCSMSTGHCSTQAPHEVHDHSTSGSMTPFSSAVPTSGRSPRRARPRAPGQLLGRGRSSPRSLPPPQQVRRLRVRVVAQVGDEQLRRERLAGVPRRALRLAAAALGARGDVEQALPRQVLDRADAEQVGVGVGLLEVERLAVAEQRLQTAPSATRVRRGSAGTTCSGTR